MLGFWVIGGTVGAALTFGVDGTAGMGIAGLWWGLCCGLSVAAAIGLVFLLRTDWVAEAHTARARIEGADGSRKPSSSDGGGGGGAGEEGHDMKLDAVVSSVASSKAVQPQSSRCGASAAGGRDSLERMPVIAAEAVAVVSAWQELNPAAQQALETV